MNQNNFQNPIAQQIANTHFAAVSEITKAFTAAGNKIDSTVFDLMLKKKNEMEDYLGLMDVKNFETKYIDTSDTFNMAVEMNELPDVITFIDQITSIWNAHYPKIFEKLEMTTPIS